MGYNINPSFITLDNIYNYKDKDKCKGNEIVNQYVITNCNTCGINKDRCLRCNYICFENKHDCLIILKPFKCNS